MAFAANPGIRLSTHEFTGGAPAISAVLLIDATGKKIAFTGQVWHRYGTASKSVRKVHFRAGAVVKAGGSGYTLSLQDPSLTAGPPMQPDETQDQTAAIAAADLTSSTWFASAALSADRSVAIGDWLSVVIEFDGGGRLGSDSLTIGTPGNTALQLLNAGPGLKTGGAWASTLYANGGLLEFSDGTFGMLAPGLPMSDLNTTAFNSGSAADEIALRFKVDTPTIVDGVVALLQMAANADCELQLYNGTTAMGSPLVLDANRSYAAATVRQVRGLIGRQELVPGTEYFLGLKPTTANNVTMYDATVNDANHLQAFPGGVEWHYAQRVDGGAWTKTTTRLPIGFGLMVAESSDGVGSGGGLIVHPGINGRLAA